MAELGLSGFSAYEDYIEDHPEEWKILDSTCQITISRFYRDRRVFDVLRSRILPSVATNILLGGGNELSCWSAGCCSGEEATPCRSSGRSVLYPQYVMLYLFALLQQI
jgi:chemotaxis protein methyltransferase CheR